MIALSAQQKELSEWRHSGTLSVGMSGLGSGIMGSGALKVANWHRSNLDATLEALKALPGGGRRLHDSGISHCPGLAGEAAHPYHIPDLPVGYSVFPALCTSGRGNLSDALASPGGAAGSHRSDSAGCYYSQCTVTQALMVLDGNWQDGCIKVT